MVPAGRGSLEGVAHYPLDAVGGVDADLGRNLVGGTDPHGAAVAAVESLGALANDDEVDVAGIGQGAGHPLVVLRRAQVHVVVEREAQLEEQPSLEDAGGDGGVSDRSQEDGVVALDGLKIVVRECVAGGMPAPRPQIEVGRGVGDGAVGQNSVEDLQALGYDLLADPVPGDYCDFQCHASIFPADASLGPPGPTRGLFHWLRRFSEAGSPEHSCVPATPRSVSG